MGIGNVKLLNKPDRPGLSFFNLFACIKNSWLEEKYLELKK